jgi:cell division protein FtsW
VAKRISIDKTLFAVTLLLVIAGLVMVFSASAVIAKEKFGSPYTFFLRQLAWAVAGFAAMLATMKLDYRRYKNPAIVFSAVAVTCLLLVAVFFLDRSHNTHRWIKLGAFSLQPSELAKPALILFLAYFLESRMKQMQDLRGTIVPAAVPVALFAALIVKQPDLGTAMACVAVAGAVFFVAGLQLRYFAYAAVAVTPVLYWLLFRVAWRAKRMIAFLDPFADPQGSGFHIIQSMIAVSTGGLAGVGLMEGKQKLFYLPEPHTDFIFAVTAEEWGLVGSLFVVTLFAIFCYRGVRTAVMTNEPFGKLLATGITGMIVIQALFNVSVVLGMLPTKGIPLPLISYGGSSLFISLASIGVLLNITQHTD